MTVMWLVQYHDREDDYSSDIPVSIHASWDDANEAKREYIALHRANFPAVDSVHDCLDNMYSIEGMQLNKRYYCPGVHSKVSNE